MKKIVVIIVVILSLSTIIVGKMHWNNKIEAHAKTALAEKPDVQIENSTEELQAEDITKKVEELSANLPEEIQVKLISAVQTGEPVNLTIVGSGSTPEDPTAWPTLLKNTLEGTYGTDIMQVSIKEITDKTSTQVLQEGLYHEIISLSPDILLLEPFMLFDNGNIIPLETRLSNITNIIGGIQAELPEVSLLLQPANPLYNAVHYPNEINRLKEYAGENGYTYLNHWDAWPDYQSVEINEYLTDDGRPNNKGHELWAGYLSKYFIAEDSVN